MPSLVATSSALARTTCVRTHYVRTNFKNSDTQEKFRKLTIETKESSRCFMNNNKKYVESGLKMEESF